MLRELPIVVTLLVGTLGCAGVAELEPAPPYVAVRARALSPGMGWVRHFGVHSYVLWRDQHGSQPRITQVRSWGLEQEGSSSWDLDDCTHALLTGAAATAAIADLRAVLAAGQLQERYPEEYVLWPGPNSNTFIAELCRAAGVWVDLPPNAVGKDWPTTVPWVLGLHRTTTGLGMQMDVFVFGAQVGLTGVEAHFFGTAAGISWWPPALKLPFLPRLGAM